MKRLWTRTTKPMKATDYSMKIWDSGDLRYERISNGIEHSWKVLGREATDTGFIETLEEIPLYNTPNLLSWQETVPVRLEASGFEIPGWIVKNIASGTSN
jgi:hypothetical protein